MSCPQCWHPPFVLVQGTQLQKPGRHTSFDEASPGTPAAPLARQNAERAFSAAHARPAEPSTFPMIPLLRVRIFASCPACSYMSC